MKPEEVKDMYVTWTNAMRKLDLGINTYGYWLKVGYIPLNTQRHIEKASKGKLKSDS